MSSVELCMFCNCTTVAQYEKKTRIKADHSAKNHISLDICSDNSVSHRGMMGFKLCIKQTTLSLISLC